MTIKTKLPAGWRVENQGLIEAVSFTHREGRGLLWCDGRWDCIWPNGMATRADGVPPASSMAEARRVGTAWIIEVEAGDG